MDVWITVVGQLALACALVGWALRRNAREAAGPEAARTADPPHHPEL